MCEALGVAPAAFGTGYDSRGFDFSHPYVKLDRDLCIACGRCVRMCDEVQGTFALTLASRGYATVVAPGSGGSWLESDCVACGGCVDSCPTGALSEPGLLDLRPIERTTTTTCGYCGVGCTLDVHTRDDDVVVDHARRAAPVNRGHACVKGRFAHGFVRSRRPADRRRSCAATGELAGDHLGRGARRDPRPPGAHPRRARAGRDRRDLLVARDQRGELPLPEAACASAIGTHNVDNCSRLCHSPSGAGLIAGVRAVRRHQLRRRPRRAPTASCSPAPTRPRPTPWSGRASSRRVLRGAGLIVVDPRRIELAGYADVHLRGRPGSNVAVFNGLAHVLLDEGLIDERFLPSAPTASRSCRSCSPTTRRSAWRSSPACRPTTCAGRRGCTAQAARPAIVYGLGITEHLHGTDGVRTLSNLAILTGNVGTAGRRRRQPAARAEQRPGRVGHRVAARPAARLPEGRRRRGARALRGGLGRLARSPAGPAHPARCSRPRSTGGSRRSTSSARTSCRPTRTPGTCRRRSRPASWSISQEIFLSRTAERADVVLPAASFLEKDGTFVNFDRRFQRVRPALAPPGDARTDFEIIHLVARALGVDLGCPTPADAMDECARLAPLFAGITHARLDREGALHWPCRSEADPGEATLYLRPLRHAERACAARRAPVPAAGRGARRGVPVRAHHRAAARALQRRHDDPPHRQPRRSCPRSGSRSAPTTRCGSASATASRSR